MVIGRPMRLRGVATSAARTALSTRAWEPELLRRDHHRLAAVDDRDRASPARARSCGAPRRAFMPPTRAPSTETPGSITRACSAAGRPRARGIFQRQHKEATGDCGSQHGRRIRSDAAEIMMEGILERCPDTSVASSSNGKRDLDDRPLPRGRRAVAGRRARRLAPRPRPSSSRRGYDDPAEARGVPRGRAARARSLPARRHGRVVVERIRFAIEPSANRSSCTATTTPTACARPRWLVEVASN